MALRLFHSKSFVALSILLACSSEPLDAGDRCSDDDECSQGMTCTCVPGCMKLICTRECNSAADCPEFKNPVCEYAALLKICMEAQDSSNQ